MPAAIANSDPLKTEICDLLAQGKTLKEICDIEGFPHRITVNRWMLEDKDFASRIARAREDQQDYFADRIMELNSSMDASNWQFINAQIRNIQWLMGKLNAKRYGDKQLHTGADGEGPIQIVSTIPRPPKETE
jgi:hypothetical protein